MGCGSGASINAQGLPVVQKDSGATLDYGFDWASDGWLAQGETITDATWAQTHAVAAEDLTLTTSDHGNGITVVWAAGGTAGQDYRLTVAIVTSLGRQDQRSLIIQVRER